jgi:hypothetical protein
MISSLMTHLGQRSRDRDFASFSTFGDAHYPEVHRLASQHSLQPSKQVHTVARYCNSCILLNGSTQNVLEHLYD